MKKRISAFFLSLVMILGLLPAGAFAAGELPYKDVPADAWYAEAVRYAHETGMMNGTGDGAFSPEATTTRATVVTLLYRVEKSPEATGETFTDVPAGAWYAKAVAWASANKIVNGMGDGLFAPEAVITREQFATILYRYAGFKGADVSKVADLSKFSDAASVSEYAKTAMAWAVEVGLVSGVDATTLSPQGGATRAQAATILMRYEKTVAPSTPAPSASPSATPAPTATPKPSRRPSSGGSSSGGSGSSDPEPAPSDTYAITKDAVLHGSISVMIDGVEVDRAKAGDLVYIHATADDGYLVDSLTVNTLDGVQVFYGKEPGYNYYVGLAFTMPAEDVIFTATFKVKPEEPKEHLYAIAKDTVLHGSISVQTSNYVEIGGAYVGDYVYVQAIPDDGYQEDTITVTTAGGKTVPIGLQSAGAVFGRKVFTMPAEDVTVTATFKALPQQPDEPEPEDPDAPEETIGELICGMVVGGGFLGGTVDQPEETDYTYAVDANGERYYHVCFSGGNLVPGDLVAFQLTNKDRYVISAVLGSNSGLVPQSLTLTPAWIEEYSATDHTLTVFTQPPVRDGDGVYLGDPASRKAFALEPTIRIAYVDKDAIATVASYPIDAFNAVTGCANAGFLTETLTDGDGHESQELRVLFVEISGKVAIDSFLSTSGNSGGSSGGSSSSGNSSSL